MYVEAAAELWLSGAHWGADTAGCRTPSCKEWALTWKDRDQPTFAKQTTIIADKPNAPPEALNRELSDTRPRPGRQETRTGLGWGSDSPSDSKVQLGEQVTAQLEEQQRG